MASTIVQIENLVKRYGDLVALDHLNLNISEGEVFGLLGPNGSGETTAINCMLSLLKYDKGTIRIFGEEMRPDNYSVKQQIGIVLQNVAVFRAVTVRVLPHLVKGFRRDGVPRLRALCFLLRLLRDGFFLCGGFPPCPFL